MSKAEHKARTGQRLAPIGPYNNGEGVIRKWMRPQGRQGHGLAKEVKP